MGMPHHQRRKIVSHKLYVAFEIFGLCWIPHILRKDYIQIRLESECFSCPPLLFLFHVSKSYLFPNLFHSYSSPPANLLLPPTNIRLFPLPFPFPFHSVLLFALLLFYLISYLNPLTPFMQSFFYPFYGFICDPCNSI